jgi:sugar lactone lactonase YvrE
MLFVILALVGVAPDGSPAERADPVPRLVRMLAPVAPLPAVARTDRSGGLDARLAVDSFAAPDTAPFGLEMVNGRLWLSDLRARRIYQLDAQNGSVLRSFPAPDQWTKDITFDGSNLWACGNYQSRLYKLDTIQGSIVASYAAPGSNPTGLSFDGTNIWHADWNSDQSQPNYVYRLDPTNGQVLGSFITPAEQPAGLAWDGSALWNADMKHGIIYRLNASTGRVIGAAGTPGPMPTGVAWSGNRLWVADWATDRVYSYHPDSGPSAVLINRPADLAALPCWQPIAIIGTVAGDLAHYRLEYGSGENPANWIPIGGLHVEPKYLDTLGVWNVSGLAQGIYTLRVKAVFVTHTDSLRRVKLSLDPQIRPGWPQAFVNASPVGVVAAPGGPAAQIFGGTHHQDFINQRLAGWNLDGSLLSGFPVVGISNCQMAPAFGKLYPSGVTVIAAGYDLNHDQMNMVRADGSVAPGWPQTGARPGTLAYLGLPVLADVGFDSGPEVLCGGSALSAWSDEGAGLAGWPQNQQFSSPAIGDLDRDGRMEIIALSGSSIYVFDSAGSVRTGFPKSYAGTSSQQYPVLGDIDNNGRLEIVFAMGHRLYALDDTGGVLPGFPRALAGSYANSPVLGDIDRDGFLEIVVVYGTFPSYSEIGAFRRDATPLPGFPKRLTGRVFRAFNEPVLGDVNGDSFPEIVMGFEVENTFEEIHALDRNGAEAAGWPRFMRDIYGYGITGSPVLGDFDSDGETDMAISSNAYWMASTDVCLWNLEQPYRSEAMPWPTQRQSNARTACLDFWRPGGISSPAEIGPALRLRAEPNPSSGSVRFTIPPGHASRVVILDAAGRTVRRLQAANCKPRAAGEAIWDGCDAAGRRAGGGIYFARLDNPEAPGDKPQATVRIVILR